MRRVIVVLVAMTGLIIVSPQHASAAVACAILPDFNGDGFGDLAVGVPVESIGAVGEAGAVQIFYGDGAGLSTGDQVFHQDSAGMNETAEGGDSFGRALATGDFNGDGLCDLGVGVPLEDIGVAGAGEVQVLYGGPGGLSTAGDQVFHQDSAGMNDTAEPGDQFGASLAAGDFDGDGRDDLAVGVPFEDIGIVNAAGAVHILYGGAAGVSSAGDQVFHQDSTGMDSDAGDIENFGRDLASGDFDNDGRDDLAVGVPQQSLGSTLRAGAVHIIYGGPGGLSSTGNAIFHQDSPDINDTAEGEDHFGRSLAAGDFDADGRDDLAVGVAESVGSVSSAGAVQILYGSPTGISAAGDQVFHQDSANMNDTAETEDQFGAAVGAGDFNGDNRSDLAVGIPNEGIGLVTGAGAAQVLYGGAGGLSAAGDQVFHQDSADMNDTAEMDDRFGSAVSATDLDADGNDDLSIGVPTENVGVIADAGAVQIVFGSSDGLTAAGDLVVHQDSPGVNDTAELSDGFGTALPRSPFH
jgi:hypothetical protein